MNKIQENKILADLIKADLKDALVNDNRWKVSGLQHFFHEYWVWWDKEIWVVSKNEELKKVLAENRIRNQVKREEVEERERKEIEKENGKPYVDSWDKERKNERENIAVFSDELDRSDWEEIKSLIAQIQPLKEKKDCERKQKVDEKLNSRKGLVYWGGSGRRMSSSDGNGREWYDFRAVENGKEYHLSIPKNHPALGYFNFDQEGFYMVEGEGFANAAVRTNGYWTAKEVNLSDKITILIYDDTEVANFAFKNNTDENKKFEEDRKERNSGNKNLTAGGKSQSVNKVASGKSSGKVSENSDLAQIKKYFLENDVKEITLKNGKLEIIHNDKKTHSSELTTNNPGLWQLVKYCQEHNQKSLSRKDLGINSDVNNSVKTTNDNSRNNLWIGGAITVGVVVLGIFVFSFTNKKSKK